ncbi:AIR synthase-related protein [Candidatus Saccharibacteria bacterium]|nr:AIR synthase-related protein [Candidatus Saccharibacteria bacterium]
MTKSQSTYAKSGVNYQELDQVKVLAQGAAAETSGNLANFGGVEIEASRGESAYVWEEGDVYRSLVIEGLGTKNLVADAMRKVTGRTYYDALARDTVAMIVNDLIVVGAMPQVVNAYFAVGDSAWTTDRERAADLVNGWAAACQEIGAVWGGGETPALKGIINPSAVDLGGSAVGVINPKQNLVLGDKLAAGDAIVLIESSGIHANGISLVRKLADENPGLYEQKLPDGRLFGEAILTPTHLYVNLVRNILQAGVQPHYMANITGHGWRKIMRATADFTYRLDKIMPIQPEFDLIQKLSGMDGKEMYATFNVGAGFAIFVSEKDAPRVIKIAAEQGLSAVVAGRVETGQKRVIIEPQNITFGGETLEVRK